MLGHTVVLLYTTEKFWDCFPQLLYHFRCPPAKHKWSSYCILMETLCSILLVVYTIVGVKCYCGFDFQFTQEQWYWAHFHAINSYLCIFFGDMLIYISIYLINAYLNAYLNLQILNYIVLLLLLLFHCRSYIYILDINTL